MSKEYDDDIVGWYTWNGRRIPIKKGQTKDDAIKENTKKIDAEIKAYEDRKYKQIEKNAQQLNGVSDSDNIVKQVQSDSLKKLENSGNKVVNSYFFVNKQGNHVGFVLSQSKAGAFSIRQQFYDTVDGKFKPVSNWNVIQLLRGKSENASILEFDDLVKKFG